jgi:hypothetical protein
MRKFSCFAFFFVFWSLGLACCRRCLDEIKRDKKRFVIKSYSVFTKKDRETKRNTQEKDERFTATATTAARRKLFEL